MSNPRKVIIIGSGPAGFTAAIYAARANLAPLLFEGLTRGGIPGGQLMITNDVENYPGFPEKIEGPALMKAFREQAIRQGRGGRLEEDVSLEVDFSKYPFQLWAGDDHETHTASSVIIATGAQAKWLDIESEHALKGRGVSACAVCDGAFFRGQDVIVVGGGDTAMEESMYLSGLCRSVTLVHRKEAFRASKTMQDRVLANSKNSQVVYNATPASAGSSTSSKGEAPEGASRTWSADRSASGSRRQGSSVAIGRTPELQTSPRGS